MRGANVINVVVTGSSGFIGFHLCQRLLQDGFAVTGIDNLSDYYDVTLKLRRQSILQENPNFQVVNAGIETKGLLLDLFDKIRPQIVIHTAAQAGVRHSIDHPRAYLDSNIIGTFELLEAARAFAPAHMLLASTSSAYGANTVMPYQETHRADHPLSFYAASKLATEGMAHSYAHLFNLPITMFRFFTVYGPWGRPDMALFKFTKAILNGDPIDVYNHGKMQRDFTYIDDLIQAIRLLMDVIPQTTTPAQQNDSLSPVAPWRVVNIGNSKPVPLMDFIAAIEDATGKTAKLNMIAMQSGDVPATWADGTLLHDLTGYRPQTDLHAGVRHFVDWYRRYYLMAP